MSKQIFKQATFNGGELSPNLYARVEIGKYNNGLATATNVKVIPQGPVRRRTGTEFIAEVKTSSEATILIPFQFSSTDAFVLELGNQYIRFYRDKAQIDSGGSPYEVTTPWNQTEVADLTYVQFGNSLYFCHPSYSPRLLTRNSTTDWVLSTLIFSPPPTVEDGLIVAETLTLSATTGSNVTATAGSATFINGDIGRQIVIIADGKTGVGSIDTYTSTTAVKINITQEFSSTSYTASEWKMDLSTLADITITAVGGGSSTAGETITIASKGGTPNLFRSSDVGKYLITAGGVALITVYNSATSIECVVQKSLDSEDDTSIWSIESDAWSADRGYPRAVGLFQERLVFGGTTAQPQTLWMSETGIYDGFGAGSDDEDSVVLAVSSQRANQISWISSARELVVGTTGAEIALQQSTSGGITPSNPPDQIRTYYGSDTQTPVTVGDELIFIGPNGRKIRAFRYDFNIDGFQAEDLLFLADHLTDSQTTITQMAYGGSESSLMYAILSNGDMLVGAYERAQEVIGWTRYDTVGAFESVHVIQENNEDVVYVVTNRTIDGSTERNVEVFDSGTGNRDTHFFSDSAILVYPGGRSAIAGVTLASPGVVTTTGSHSLVDGDTVYIYDLFDEADNGMIELNSNIYTVANKTSTTFELNDSSGNAIDTSAFTAWVSSGFVYKQSTAVSGLDHLEGKSVEIKAEGAIQPTKTVSSGAITLDTTAGIVTIGLGYDSTIKTLRYPFGTLGDKTIFGVVRYISVSLLVNESSIPIVNGEFNPSRNANDDMDSSVPLFSGILEYAGEEWSNDGQLTITKSGPFPMVLLGIFGFGNGEDK